MAYLSNYLSSRRSSSGSSGRSSGYAYPKPYQPYSVPRRGVSAIESSGSNFGGQDLASALLMQRQVNKSATPSTSFDSSYDYDPILSQIQALATQSVANSTNNASQLRKQALISSGQTDIGGKLGFDADTLAAAGQNPESEYAQLQREFQQRQKDLEEAMSAQNLLYSGEYTNNLSQLAQGKASAEASIGSRLREMLSGIDTGLLTSQETARQQALDAQTQAELLRSYGELNPTGSMTDSSGLEWDAGAATALAQAGYPADVVSGAASAYAASHPGYSVHGVKQEGHIEYQNGVPGVWIKYNTAAGASTEWTPLPTAPPSPPPAPAAYEVGNKTITLPPGTSGARSVDAPVSPSADVLQTYLAGTNRYQ